ncbi:NADH:ubiquinone reductase (Na(+)-transporting) subunit F [Halomonas heilongjiangensis]|uniref:Oxidoreductase n=1 Tax=Halomonas heilongjiangensis TaxID=1387883 RepID=A0A2N7TFH0_9GAMM|nr:2Fe-2S iron-sulfur cluster-binding protein [Halomonas heilongjiangensis]PMR66944.1 oxidoreductase [Halomonas heilongjiangensis]PXX88546.1 oxidoreductase [Halomonas heilongjiangensis]
MSHDVQITTAGKAITVEDGDTILDAALAAGIAYPHSCQAGRCGACKSRLVEGEVEMLPHTRFSLSEEERDAGLVLACRAMPRSDCTIAWLGDDEELAAHPLQKLDCVVVELDDVTHDIKRVRLQVESGGSFTFTAGQYAQVTFPGCPPREYSMANRPDEPIIEFHVRHVPGGTTSAHVARELAVGDSVQVEGPYGTSHLRERHSGPIVVVAGGSGLAPVKSILETALAAGMRQPIHFYFGARDERDVYLEPHFEELARRHGNLRTDIVLSAPSGATRRSTGLVTEVMAMRWERVTGCRAYLAGPPPMVEAATELLLARGVPADNIHADAFYTSADREPTAATPEEQAVQSDANTACSCCQSTAS